MAGWGRLSFRRHERGVCPLVACQSAHNGNATLKLGPVSIQAVRVTLREKLLFACLLPALTEWSLWKGVRCKIRSALDQMAILSKDAGESGTWQEVARSDQRNLAEVGRKLAEVGRSSING